MNAMLTVTPITPRIGAEVSGIDLSRPLDEREFAAVKAAFVAHHVLFFRRQHLDAPALKRFAGYFGPLLPHARGDAATPEIMPFRSDKPGTFSMGTQWHTDSSYNEHPPLGSILHFHQAPAVGADLAWADMHAAYDALSPAMRTYLSGLAARHEAARSGFASDRSASAAFAHPLVSAHPDTGRRRLYFSSVYIARIEDLPQGESDAILRFLGDHVTNPFFHLRLRMEPDSLVLWDNRCTQHSALWNFDAGVMAGLRAQIEAVAPTGKAAAAEIPEAADA